MSTSSYIQITVDNEASRFLRDEFGAVKFRQTLRRGMERGMLKVHGQIPEYPPPRAMTQVGRSSKLWSKGARKVSGQKGRWWASSYVRMRMMPGRVLRLDRFGARHSVRYAILERI